MTDPEKTQFLYQPARRAPAPNAQLLSMSAVAGVPGRIPLTDDGVALECGPEGRVRVSGTDAPNVWLMQYGGAWAIEARGKDVRVLVNGSPVTLCFLKSGDQIDLDGNRFVFRLDAEDAQPAPAAPHANGTQVQGATAPAEPPVATPPSAPAAGHLPGRLLRALTGTRIRFVLWALLVIAVALGLSALLVRALAG